MTKSLYDYTTKTDTYMMYYNPIKIPFDSTDYLIKIEKKYEFKPGKLAFDLYGSERLGWIFRYFNNDIINDPIFDLKENILIRIPTKDRLNRYI